jgi:hypothetical protein
MQAEDQGEALLTLAQERFHPSRRSDGDTEEASSPIATDMGALGRALLRFFHRGAQLSGDFEYTWPLPTRPVHRVGGSLIGELAACCQRSLHRLGLERCWEGVLRHAVGEDACPTTLTSLLHPGLSRNLQVGDLVL